MAILITLAGVVFLSLPLLLSLARQCLAYHSVALFCPRLLSVFEPWNNKYVRECMPGNGFGPLSYQVVKFASREQEK